MNTEKIYHWLNDFLWRHFKDGIEYQRKIRGTDLELKHIKGKSKLLVGLCALFLFTCIAGVMFGGRKVSANMLPEDGPADQAAEKVGQGMRNASTNNHTMGRSMAVKESSPYGTDVFNIGDPSRPRVDAIDVASYQSDMTLADYQKIKSAGVKTVIVKLTEGASYTNPAALTQIKNAAAAGLNVDVYHYFTSSTISGAKNEANYLLNFLKKNKLNKNILIMNDVEDDSTQTTQIAANLNAFWDVLSTAGYKQHGIYTGASYLYRDAAANTVGFKRTWKAQYPYHPKAGTNWQTDYGAWQFSPTAKISNGDYTGYIDVEIDYVNLFTQSAGTKPFQ